MFASILPAFRGRWPVAGLFVGLRLRDRQQPNLLAGHGEHRFFEGEPVGVCSRVGGDYWRGSNGFSPAMMRAKRCSMLSKLSGCVIT
jgi:hypothetical protein